MEKEPTRSPRSYADYENLFSKSEVPYVVVDNFIYVGNIITTQGWLIHVSSVKSELLSLLKTVIPIINSFEIPFKVTKDEKIAISILNGELGQNNTGKILTAYPSSLKTLNELVKELISATNLFNYTIVPTDFHLGGTIFTRYGAFNPILKYDHRGIIQTYIYDQSQTLIKDLPSVPFLTPTEQPWPFSDIKPPLPPTTSNTLLRKYYKISTLKSDVKGDVIKGVYLSKQGIIKYCLIKQGIKNMLSDDIGRDMWDRLNWQFLLHTKLSKSISIPKIIDHFEEDESKYLVMEFIRGISITNYVNKIYFNKTWKNISLREKRKILNISNLIIEIVESLHKEKYVHRDLSTENLLISRFDKIHLIDLELTWSLSNGIINSPFTLGTPGYMSPQQAMQNQPSFQDDIFSIGGILIKLFCNLHPIQIDSENQEDLFNSILYFTDSPDIAAIISKCRNREAELRPRLTEIKKIFSKLESSLYEPSRTTVQNQSFSKQINPELAIKIGLEGLFQPPLISKNNIWTVKKTPQISKSIGGFFDAIPMSFYEGISGIIWTLQTIRKLGIEVPIDNLQCTQNIELLYKYLLNPHVMPPAGLYRGTAGIVISLIDNIETSKEPYINIQELIIQCIARNPEGFNLGFGISGHGIAALNLIGILGKESVFTIASSFLNTLLNNQEKDGSWNLYFHNKKKNAKAISITYGISGILTFILKFLDIFPDRLIEKKALKCLDFISSNVKHLSKDETLDISEILIKGYLRFNDIKYLKCAEKLITTLDDQKNLSNLSLDQGLAAHGFLLLNAYKATNNKLYYTAAEEIAKTLCNTLILKKDRRYGFWATTISISPSPGLLNGHCGIIYYLANFTNISTLKHPLLDL